MSDQDAYVLLLSSLPRLNALFLAKQPPLSRLKLERRLKLLEPEDRESLCLVEHAFDWRQLTMSTSDADVIERGRHAISTIKSRALRNIVRNRLELRTVIAALRRRALGEGPPAGTTPWGFGRWLGRIRRYWTDPGFRLDGVYPWIREADRLITTKDIVALERMILLEAHRLLQRQAQRHIFDLEAVVIYVLKWNIVDRWARANGEAAARRFDDLVSAGLGTYGALSFEGDD